MGSMTEEILDKFDKYCCLTNRAPSGVGAEIFNDSNFYKNLKRGRGITDRTYDKAKNWFKKNWPNEIPKTKHARSMPKGAESVNTNLT